MGWVLYRILGGFGALGLKFKVQGSKSRFV